MRSRRSHPVAAPERQLSAAELAPPPCAPGSLRITPRKVVSVPALGRRAGRACRWLHPSHRTGGLALAVPGRARGRTTRGRHKPAPTVPPRAARRSHCTRCTGGTPVHRAPPPPPGHPNPASQLPAPRDAANMRAATSAPVVFFFSTPFSMPDSAPLQEKP